MKTIRLSLAVLGLFIGSLTAQAQTTATIQALRTYLSVKDALVATDGDKAKAEAMTLVTALKNMKVAGLSVADKKALAMAKTQANAISKTTDVDTQREAFEGLSNSMISLTKATKTTKQKAAPTYVQFCPMAANGKGASWMSDKKEVRNPYYGDKMLKCGSVKEEI